MWHLKLTRIASGIRAKRYHVHRLSQYYTDDVCVCLSLYLYSSVDEVRSQGNCTGFHHISITNSKQRTKKIVPPNCIHSLNSSDISSQRVSTAHTNESVEQNTEYCVMKFQYNTCNVYSYLTNCIEKKRYDSIKINIFALIPRFEVENLSILL